MTRSTEHRWLDRFAWITAGSTLLLIGLGGLVTSKGAGMAVPDWPTTYGYNMFLFPVHLWKGGIFYEHTHRLLASFVGLLTTILAVWLWIRDSRRWLRWLGVAAFVAVVAQGVLGGLRVTLFKDELGIVHASLGQAFLVLLSLIALFASGRGAQLASALRQYPISRALRWMAGIATVLILVQLILGATMRHQHAGLAVPDFPLAYGKLWPPMDAASIDLANRLRIGVQEYRPITAFHIGLHMAHRIGAVVILALVCALAWKTRREHGKGAAFTKLSGIWAWLIGLQAALGALTVWSNKAADVATAHVLLGAVSLVVGSVLTAGIVCAGARARSGVQASQPDGSMLPGAPLAAKPAGT
ncbi:MAG: heme A synthase [Verrucomicrobiia bacterium]